MIKKPHFPGIPENYLFSHDYLVKLIMPLIGEQFLAVTIGMADTVMVATNGESAVSAVSLVDSFSWLMIALFSAFATGGAVVASQYLGNGDKKNACGVAKQLFNLSAFTGVIIVIICLPFRHQILNALFGKIDRDVMQNSVVYFVYMILSYPALAIYNSCAALYRSMGDSKMSLKVSLLMNIINIGGNAVFIYGYNMGVAGAGLGTLLSRTAAALIMVILLCGKKPLIHFDHLERFEWDSHMIFRILGIGVPNGVEGSLFQIGKLVVQTFMAGFGTAAIAANAISNSVASFANIPGNAIGLATITVIGQCVGAGEKKQAVYYTKRLLWLSYSALAVLSVLLFIFSSQIVLIFNLSNEATELATGIIRTFMVISTFFWPASFMLPNSLRAAGDAKFTMWTSMISMWLFRVISSYILSVTLGWGLYGVWVGMYIDWICRSICFVLRFRHGKWLEKKVI